MSRPITHSRCWEKVFHRNAEPRQHIAPRQCLTIIECDHSMTGRVNFDGACDRVNQPDDDTHSQIIAHFDTIFDLAIR